MSKSTNNAYPRFFLGIMLTFTVILITIASIPRHEYAKERSSKIKELVNAYVEEGQFNGAIIVSGNDQVYFKDAFGFANMEHEVANTTSTKFRIGSITKQFIALLALQLVAEEKLDLHASISKYLSNYPEVNAQKITLHHLLTHSSGIPNQYPSTKRESIRPDSYKSKDLVDEFAALPLEFEPGERFSYSNAGYNLLGHLIEEVSEQSLETLLNEKIFNPLGMKNTGIGKHRSIIKERASGYFEAWSQYYNSNYVDMSTVFAAGYMYSTVEDFILWSNALSDESLLPRKYLDLMLDIQIKDPDYNGHYGYGISIKNKTIGNSSKEIKTIGHDGVIDGFCALFTRIPETGETILLLSNVRRAPLNAMTQGILGILFNETYDFPKKSLAKKLLSDIENLGINQATKLFKKELFNEVYYLSENEMNGASYKLLQDDRLQDAESVLLLAISQLPDAFNLYDSLGEVQRNMKKADSAIQNYKKSLELNPSNENARRVHQEMGVEF